MRFDYEIPQNEKLKNRKLEKESMEVVPELKEEQPMVDFSKLILIVVLPDIGDNIAYRDGLHFCCQEVYPYRNQKKV